jgi:hypothetical protein
MSAKHRPIAAGVALQLKTLAARAMAFVRGAASTTQGLVVQAIADFIEANVPAERNKAEKY